MNDDQAKKNYELWLEWNRIAPPLVLEWEELTEYQREPFYSPVSEWR